MKHLFILIFLLYSIGMSAVENINHSFIIELEQTAFCAKNYTFWKQTKQGLSYDINFAPSLRFGLALTKNSKIKQSITLGYNYYSAFYNQEALDIYYTYPIDPEKKMVYYYKYIRLSNLLLGYKYYFNLSDNLSLYLGMDINIPVYYYCNTFDDNLVIGYGIHGNGIEIKTRHEEYISSSINDDFYKWGALQSGVDFSVKNQLNIGFGINFKYMGDVMVADFLTVKYSDSNKTFDYNQKVYLSNKYIGFLLRITYLFNFNKST